MPTHPPNRLEMGYVVESFDDADLLVPELRVDDQSLLDRHTLDLRQLVASTSGSGDYWIFTCGCGEPGCAGIESAGTG